MGTAVKDFASKVFPTADLNDLPAIIPLSTGAPETKGRL